MKKTNVFVLVLVLAVGTKDVHADFTFGMPTNLGSTVNSTYHEANVEVSADGLSLFFSSNQPGGNGSSDLWVATRLTKDDSWSKPVNLGPPVNSSQYESGPSISVDGLFLYFDAVRSGGYGDRDIWVTTRETTDDPWGEPVNLGPTVNTPHYDGDPDISADGLSLHFHSTRPGGYGNEDIWVSTRATKDDNWSAPLNLGPIVNDGYYNGDPEISVDGLVLFFSCYSAENDDIHIWMSARSTTSGQWESPMNLGSLANSSVYDVTPSLSGDGRMLFFNALNGPGGNGNWDMWQVPIVPIVDLNGDGIVDAADMCLIVDNWGTDNSLCDIGPMPWGDGVVDVQDLIVLAEHLCEEVPPAE